MTGPRIDTRRINAFIAGKMTLKERVIFCAEQIRIGTTWGNPRSDLERFLADAAREMIEKGYINDWGNILVDLDTLEESSNDNEEKGNG